MALRNALVIVTLGCTAAVAQAAVVLPAGATWQYTFTEPGAGWQVGSDGGTWLTGPAPFGNTASAPFAALTNWPADGLDGDDLWVRIQVDMTGLDRDSVIWDLGVDNGYKLFINGVEVAADNAEGFTTRWEYSGTLSASQLNPASNWVAVALEDHGGFTAFDMQMQANPVPEPATYALMLLGLAAVVGVARRR